MPFVGVPRRLQHIISVNRSFGRSNVTVNRTLVPLKEAKSTTTMLSSAAASFAPVGASVLAPTKPAVNNKVMGLSAFPDMQRLRGGDFAGPAGAAAARNVSIVWFR